MSEAAPITANQTAESTQQDDQLSASSIYTREFWLIFAATFALNSAANLFVLFPLYIVRLGGGATTIGAVMGTAALAALIVRPLASSAIDRRGHRWTALWTLAIDACVVTLYIPLHALGWAIYAVRALHGAVEGTARVALFTMVYEILPPGRQGEAMATFSLSGMLPAAFAALLGEMVLRNYGFHAFFLAAAALCIIGAGALVMLPGGREQAAAAPPVGNTASNSGAISYRALVSNRALLTLWVVTLFFGLASSSRVSFIAPFAYRRGIHSVGVYFTIFALVAIVARLSGPMMDRVGLERMLTPSLTTLAVGIALIAGTGHYHLLEIAAAVGGLGHGFAYPVLSALVVKNTPEGGMGRAATVYTSLWDLSAMLGPYLLGVTAHSFGYPVMFVVAGMLAIVAAVYMTVREPGARFRRLA
jgi:MFS family permease